MFECPQVLRGSHDWPQLEDCGLVVLSIDSAVSFSLSSGPLHRYAFNMHP